MRDKMNMRKLLWITAQIGGWIRFGPRKNLTLCFSEMPRYALHLGCSLRQLRIFLVGSYTVADEQQFAIMFSGRNIRCGQQSQRTGGSDGRVFNPEVLLRISCCTGVRRICYKSLNVLIVQATFRRVT